MISIEDIRSGGEAAFTAVFKAGYAKVYHFLLKKTGSAATAQELAQLTFIKLWEFRHTLSEDHSVDTQLFRMASGVLVDHWRREMRQRRLLSAAAGRSVEVMEPAFEQTDYLMSLTNRLPPVRKKIFLLHRIHGHSHKEIAELLSISIRTVEDHMAKAIRQIRSIASHLFFF